MPVEWKYQVSDRSPWRMGGGQCVLLATKLCLWHLDPVWQFRTWTMEALMSDVITITVVPGSDAPVVQMNSISIEERYPRDEIYFNLTSFSDDGQITEVAFYVNGQLFTSMTDSVSMKMVWEPFLPGRYQIYAVVKDNQGNITTTDVHTVVISDYPFITSIDLLYPNSDYNHSFAPGSDVPIIAQVDYDYNQTNISYVEGILDDDINIFLSEAAEGSGRWTGYISDFYLESGTHNIRLVAYNEDLVEVGTLSEPFVFEVMDYDPSLTPSISLNSIFDRTITTSSVLPLTVTGDDPDGYLATVGIGGWTKN